MAVQKQVAEGKVDLDKLDSSAEGLCKYIQYFCYYYHNFLLSWWSKARLWILKHFIALTMKYANKSYFFVPNMFVHLPK